MKIAWATNLMVQPEGSAFGYTLASVQLLNALGARGDVALSPDADVVVWFCHPQNFWPFRWPRPNCKHVLFTMYELDPPPPEFHAAFTVADAVVVPSRFCAHLFRNAIGSTPLFVSPLGFDPAAWREPEKPRMPVAPPFTFLFVGDRNDRKGWHVLMEAWGTHFARLKHARLYMKMSAYGRDEERPFVERGNVTVDARKLPQAELRALFDAAHAFVFPSLGEGFGLPALEAVACALPIVATDSGGVMEFLDPHLAWMVPTRRWQLRTSETNRPWGRRCMPDELAGRMVDVVDNYPAASKMARKLARRVRTQFTWDRAAEALVGHLRDLEARGRRQAA